MRYFKFVGDPEEYGLINEGNNNFWQLCPSSDSEHSKVVKRHDFLFLPKKDHVYKSVTPFYACLAHPNEYYGDNEIIESDVTIYNEDLYGLSLGFCIDHNIYSKDFVDVTGKLIDTESTIKNLSYSLFPHFLEKHKGDKQEAVKESFSTAMECCDEFNDLFDKMKTNYITKESP